MMVIFKKLKFSGNIGMSRQPNNQLSSVFYKYNNDLITSQNTGIISSLRILV